MGLSTIFVRPFNFVFCTPVARATSRHTSNWGVGRLLAKPDTCAVAFNNALDRVHASPKLAVSILAGNFSTTERKAVIKNICARANFTQTRTSSKEELPLREAETCLPAFFKLLAMQSQNTVQATHDFWCNYNSTARAGKDEGDEPLGQCRFELGPRVTLTARHSRTDVERDFNAVYAYTFFFNACEVDGLTFNF